MAGSVCGTGGKGDYLENRGMILVVGSDHVKGSSSSENPQSGSDTPFHLRLVAVMEDIDKQVTRWLLYLAGMVSTLDEVKECKYSIPAVAPVTVDPSPASPATETGPFSTTSQADSLYHWVYNPGEVSGNSGGTGQPALVGPISPRTRVEADIYIDGRQTVFKTPFVAYA